jgi:hypothetical protein
MNDDLAKGPVKCTKEGDLVDFASLRGWAIRCFSKQIEEITWDARKLERVLLQASTSQVTKMKFALLISVGGNP